MKYSDRPIAAIPLAVSLLWAGSAYSADAVVKNPASPSGDRGVSDTDMSQVKPYSNPLPPPDTSKAKAEPDYMLLGVPGAVSGSEPAENPGESREGENDSRTYGTFGVPYTSTRVALGGSNQTSAVGASFLSSTYPYRTIGKLTFSAGYCSASLIRRSVIVTAAHCIQRFGSGSSTFSGWQFTPGHYGAAGATVQQIRPYGTWNWSAHVRPATWANGTDIGSGSARDNDLAVIALAKNSSNQFIGDLTGWLGYGWNNPSFISSSKTGNLSVAATSTLGYPGLMDLGTIMQRADGPSYLTTISSAGQILQGNNFTGGSSGGPWVVNFVSANPDLSGGAALGTFASTWVIGVTSWGSADPNAGKDNYSSQFRQNTRYPNASYGIYGAGNIASLLQTLCSAQAGGGLTYAQAGYCN